MERRTRDLDIRFERDGASYKTVVLGSPVGDSFEAEFDPPFTDDQLETFAGRMRRGRSTRGINGPEAAAAAEAAQAAEAKERGDRLFKALFHDDLLICLRSNLAAGGDSAGVLRIRLRLGVTPELANLPWEYLYDRQHNRFLCLGEETSVVRHTAISEAARPLPVTGPIRMLVMVSSPTDYDPLDAEGEWVKLNEALTEQRGRITLERLPEATLETLRRSLGRGEYHIFHFIGHGGFDTSNQEGVLVLTARDGTGHLVSDEDLGIELGNLPSLRLAVLNACESTRSDAVGPSTEAVGPFTGVAQSLVQQKVPAVVAMHYEISDRAAVAFARGFYSAVADGLSIEASMTRARRFIHDISDLEWATPVLYLRSDSSQLFEIPKATDRLAALKDHNKQADLALDAGQWADAIEHLEAIVTIDPSFQDAARRLERARQQLAVAHRRQEAERLEDARRQNAEPKGEERPQTVAPDEPSHNRFSVGQVFALIVVAAVVVALGFAAFRVFTDPSGSSPPTVVLSPSSGPPGTTVTVTGTGYHAQETIMIYFRAVEVGTTLAGPNGAFTAQITIPDTPFRNVRSEISARGKQSTRHDSAPFMVQ